MSFAHRSSFSFCSRGVVPAVGAVLLALAPVSELRADLRDGSAWDVLAARTVILDAVAWQGRLAGAVEGGGILLFDPTSGSLELLDTTRDLSSLRVQALAVGDDGRLWAGTGDAGIMRLDPGGTVRAITALQQQIDVRAIAADGDFVYYGGPQGGGSLASGLAEQSFTADTGLPGDNVLAVATAQNRAWFGTDAGVGLFDRALNQVSIVNDGLVVLGVNALVAEGDDVVLGNSAGLFRLDETEPGAPAWVAFSPPLAVNVLDIARVPDAWAVLAPGNVVYTLIDGELAWTSGSVSPSEVRSVCVTFDDEGSVWLGGSRLDPTLLAADATALFHTTDGRTSPPARSVFGFNVRSIAVDGEGGAWIGGFPVRDGLTHWRADESLGVYARVETGVASGAGNGWMSGTKNGIVIDDQGDLWVSTFTSGVTRLRPAANGDPSEATYFHLRPDSSPLQSSLVRAIAKDPKGRIWFGSSGEAVVGDRNVGIDVLLDPADPLDPASWIKITPQNSELAGNGIWSLDFEGDDVVWITVQNAGLQRWDYDGPLGTGDIEPSAITSPLAWDLIAALPEPSGTAVSGARDVAIGPDGRTWLATDGSGLFGFVYNSFSIGPASVDRYFTSRPRIPFMGDRLRAVEIDAAGSIWTASDVGLQRVRTGGNEPTVESWTDVAGFLRNDLGASFLPNIVSPIGGSELLRLAYDAVRDRLYVGSTTAVSRLRLDAEVSGSEQAFDVTLRPNPIRDVERFYVEAFEGVADVEIYNLSGVLVHTARGIRSGDLVWDTRNIMNERVVSGLYVVRVLRGDDVVLKTLAVER